MAFGCLMPKSPSAVILLQRDMLIHTVGATPAPVSKMPVAPSRPIHVGILGGSSFYLWFKWQIYNIRCALSNSCSTPEMGPLPLRAKAQAPGVLCLSPRHVKMWESNQGQASCVVNCCVCAFRGRESEHPGVTQFCLIPMLKARCLYISLVIYLLNPI